MEVKGKVTFAEDNSPIPGVTVVIDGTTNGTITDFEGNYSLKDKRGDKLQFSFIGYATKV